MTNRRKVSIFGSTGSIGANTVNLLLETGGARKFDVKVLSGGENVKLLANQAVRLKTDLAVTAFNHKFEELKFYLKGSGIKVAAGEEAIVESASINSDWTMSAIIGAAGIKAGLHSVAHGGTIALANKETMVCAGDLVNKSAKKYKTKIIPVDSEHSAIFQCLRGETIEEIENVTLTASGGPFKDLPINKLKMVTPDEAANHPNWSMGKKISIDSASMFNKGLEVIEAHKLFALKGEMIKVLIHPESIIHALINFRDGSSVAQMSIPDMQTAINFALNYPERSYLNVERMNLAKLSALTFEEVDYKRWPSLGLAYDVINLGGSAGIAYNASKEEALAAYINKEIGFLDMYKCVETVIGYLERERHFVHTMSSLEDIFENDNLARGLSQRYLRDKNI